jgi:phage/plasmid-associated DNA primase
MKELDAIRAADRERQAADRERQRLARDGYWRVTAEQVRKDHPELYEHDDEEVSLAPQIAQKAHPEVSDKVVPLAPKIAQKALKGGTAYHVIVGETMLGVMRSRQGKDILVTAGEVWRYQDGLWMEPPDASSWLNGELEVIVQALEIPSAIKLISESKQWLLRSPKVIKHDVAWDSHGKVPTRSGLLDIRTLTLEPARPEHFATWRIECDYDPDAKAPWWEIMLNDFFSDRPEDVRAATIATLQEILGTALIENKSKALTRALILEGPSDAGKTRILDVMSGLLSDRPIATPFDALSGAHGLMEFRRRAPWLLHEAFNAGTWHLSSVVKSILTGDPVQINVKNGAITTQRIRSPVFWGTNHPPQFKEATKAIVNRMIVVKCRTVFDPQHLIGAAKEARRRNFAEPSDLILKTEMPGLLNWAIVGITSRDGARLYRHHARDGGHAGGGAPRQQHRRWLH